MAKALDALYATFNTKYFGGKLPPTSVKWSKLLPRGQFAEYRFLFLRDKGKRVRVYGAIILATWMKPWRGIMEMTLLHEMLHVKLGDQKEEHSKEFYRGMRGLARKGAFDELW